MSSSLIPTNGPLRSFNAFGGLEGFRQQLVNYCLPLIDVYGWHEIRVFCMDFTGEPEVFVTDRLLLPFNPEMFEQFAITCIREGR
uniref:Glutamine synthetase n=1 Tax=Steinernema glaseri TaxID=37863 RepID=A0A1I7ZLK2_9BILA